MTAMKTIITALLLAPALALAQFACKPSSTPTDGGNLASDVMGLFSGYGTPVGA